MAGWRGVSSPENLLDGNFIFGPTWGTKLFGTERNQTQRKHIICCFSRTILLLQFSNFIYLFSLSLYLSIWFISSFLFCCWLAFLNAPVVSSDGNLMYLVVASYNFFCISAQTRNTMWEDVSGRSGYTTEPRLFESGSDNIVYVAETLNGRLRQHNAANGQRNWEFDCSDWTRVSNCQDVIESEFSISGDGNFVYYGDIYGRVISLQVAEFQTNEPTIAPPIVPSDLPSDKLSKIPSGNPSYLPSSAPSFVPSLVPSGIPSGAPSSIQNTAAPSVITGSPSDIPTAIPSVQPLL